MLRSLIVVFVLGSALAAQTGNLSTNYTAPSGQSGCMFDLRALVDLRVQGLDLNLDAGLWDIEVWTTPGGFLGKEQTPSAWTRVAQALSVSSRGPGQATRFPTAFCAPIARNATVGVYVTLTNGIGLNYAVGTSVGVVAASNSAIEILTGTGNIHPFGPFFSPRVFSGTIYYEQGGLAQPCTPLAPPLPPAFQVNAGGVAFDIEGVQSNGLTAAIVLRCTGTSATARLAGAVSQRHELAYALQPIVPSGTVLASGTQRTNLSLSGLAFLYGGAVPGPIPLPSAELLFPVTLSIPFVASAQAFFEDPTHPDGIRLTQGVQLEATNSVTWPAGPASDEEVVSVPLTATPSCFGSITAFGTVWTVLHIESNGRVQFGAPSTDFSPSVAEAQAGSAFVGIWGDLDPGAGGVVRLSSTAAPGLRVEFDAVPPFLGGGTAVRFAIEIERAGGFVLDRGPALSLDAGLAGWRRNAFLGATPGGGAADPGQVVFLRGQSGNAATATEMIYRFGEASRLLAGTGITSLRFGFDAAQRLTWTAP